MASRFARSRAAALLLLFASHARSLVAPTQQSAHDVKVDPPPSTDASPQQPLHDSKLDPPLSAGTTPPETLDVDPPRSLTDSDEVTETDEFRIGPPLVPISMQPDGAYGKHSASQAAYLGLLQDGIVGEIKEDAIILDLGCADGYNSIPLIRALKTRVASFAMVFVDLPNNDWQTARKTLQSNVRVYPEDGRTTLPFFHNGAVDYIPEAKGVLVAKSFYERLAPDNSIDVVLSGTSLQYLSPGGNMDKIYHAQTDWVNFLQRRSKELKPGGSLHITALHTEKQGQNLGPIWDLVRKVLKESVDLGMLSQQARATWVWPGYSRTTGEFLYPFAMGLLPDLRIESMNTVRLESPYWAMADENAEKFVEMYVPSVMAWISPYMMETLPIQVVEFLEAKLYTEVMANPRLWRHDFDQIIMVVRKAPPSLPFFR